MALSPVDYLIFTIYIIVVITVGVYYSRKQENSADYFLAGRNLTWWIIGGSLIASNISTEHFVGMSGSGYEMGLAIASYEWLAAVTLVLAGKFLLPVFLKNQIYTMPQFLEIRFNHLVRAILSVLMIFAYIFIALAAVLYSGGLVINTLFGFSLIFSILILSIIAGAYTVYGGLKAVVFTDIVQVIVLIIGGIIATVIGINAIGGLGNLWATSHDKFHMVLPLDHPELPWIGVFIGLWIPNIFYWGCNQFITQRALAAKSIEEAQKGVVFAGFLKLLIPFIVVVPGIIAFSLYGSEIPRADMAYPYLLSRLLPVGLRGVILAALMGAIMSSLDSMLNSTATIFTVDIYSRYLHKRNEEKHLIKVGRISTVVILVLATSIAPLLTRFHLIFSYIQKFWGFVSPGVVVTFLFGVFWKRATSRGALAALILSIPVYSALQYIMPGAAFLNQMSVSFTILSIIMIVVSLFWKSEKDIAKQREIDMERDTVLKKTSKIYNRLSIILIVIVVLLYIIFF